MAPVSSFKVVLALVLVAAPGSLCKKPVKRFLWPIASINSDLRGFLAGTEIQVDQTGNPLHALNLVASFPGATCHPASPIEVQTCFVNCRKNFIGQPNLLKMCVNSCSGLQDCANQCVSHSTANYVKYGIDMMLALNQSCTPNKSSPDVNGTDVTNLIPNPIADGCHLTRLRISFSDDITETEVISGKGIHINVKAETDDPTMRCGGIVGNPTWHHTSFDLYFNPGVASYKVNWAAISSLNVDVGWWLDWIYQLNHKIKTDVNKFMNNLLGNPSVALDINKVLTFQLARDLKEATGDDVDDFVSISAVDATGILVTYVPLCSGSDGCGCTTSCNGLHFCEEQYWNSTATAATCVSGSKCLTSGDCCTPSCKPGACGSDGCGGTCKTCARGQTCVNNVCQGCTPESNCMAKLCHMNNCGFYCGHCNKPGYVCDDSEGCVSNGLLPGKPPRALMASRLGES